MDLVTVCTLILVSFVGSTFLVYPFLYLTWHWCLYKAIKLEKRNYFLALYHDWSLPQAHNFPKLGFLNLMYTSILGYIMWKYSIS